MNTYLAFTEKTGRKDIHMAERTYMHKTAESARLASMGFYFCWCEVETPKGYKKQWFHNGREVDVKIIKTDYNMG